MVMTIYPAPTSWAGDKNVKLKMLDLRPSLTSIYVIYMATCARYVDHYFIKTECETSGKDEPVKFLAGWAGEYGGRLASCSNVLCYFHEISA